LGSVSNGAEPHRPNVLPPNGSVRLMARSWPLDLDVEIHKPIEQGCLPVEMPVDPPRPRLASIFKKSEPHERSQDAGLHRACRSIPGAGAIGIGI
jgi:hypothetical protein